MKSPLGLEARLPVFDLFKDALFLLWSKRSRLVVMFLPLILVLVVVDHFSTQLQTELMAAIAVAGESSPEFEKNGQLFIFMFISALLSVLLATTVHRFTLQDAAHWPKNALRIPTRYDWRYLFRSIVIGVAGAVAGTLFVMMISLFVGLFGGVEAVKGAATALVVPGIMLAIYVMARLSVTLPEIAIGTAGSDLQRAWRMSEGNGSRLMIVVLLLPFLVSMPFLMVGQLGTVWAGIIAAFGVYFMTLISITVLSLSYQFLIEFYEPQDGESVTPEQNRNDDDGMDA